MREIGLGSFDPNTLPMDAFSLEGARDDIERPISLKAPWVYGQGAAEVSSGAYTLEVGVFYVLVTTASAVTITIPAGLPLYRAITVARTMASTAAVTVSTSGSETVEGGATFVTHGAFVSSSLNDAEVTLRKKTPTSWKFVAGVVSGSTGGGAFQRFPDGSTTTTAARWK